MNGEVSSNIVPSGVRGICPSGWHMPSYAEWTTLINFAGGAETAGAKLKADSGWASYNGKSGNGTDAYGFAALPGGYGGSVYYFDVGRYGYWWSTTANSSYDAYRQDMYYGYDGAYKSEESKSRLLSVRCLRD